MLLELLVLTSDSSEPIREGSNTTYINALKKFVHTLTGMLEFKHLVVDHVHQFLHPIPRFTADVDLADHVRKSALLGFLDLYELAVDLHYHLFLKGFWEIVASFAVGEDVSVSAHNDDRSSRGPCLHQDKSCYNTI